MRITLLILLTLFTNSLIAQVIQAPTLICIKGDSLIYNKANNTCGPFLSIDVYGSQERNGPYMLIENITNIEEFAYEHKTPSNEIWYYYLQSNFNCPGLDILSSDTLDNQPPAVSPLISISVENGVVFLEWTESLSPQTWGYVIYRVTDAGTVPIDTIAFGTTAIDVFATPNEKSETYFVTAIDQCGNTSAFVEPHNSIFLQATNSPCNQSIQLSWNLYENWVDGIEAQEIWASKNNAVAERIAVLQGDINTFDFQNAENGVTYDFYINAIQRNTGVNATSNSIEIGATIVNPVGNLLVKNVTFTDDAEIELLWEWNADAALKDIQLFRSFDNVNFDISQPLNLSSPVEDPASYLLDPISENERKTFYRIRTTDQCDTATISNYISTIFLEGMAQPDKTDQLIWTPYDSRIGTVNSYAIYRVVDEMPLFLRRLDGNTTNYAAPIISTTDTNACYFVEAEISVTFAKAGIENYVSRSNTACLAQIASVVMPNAFAPNGANRVFKPTILFQASIKNYYLAIYNRYGGKIFESIDPNIGWNGKKDGREVPMGAYTYLIQLEQASGESIEQGGVLMLIR